MGKDASLQNFNLFNQNSQQMNPRTYTFNNSSVSVIFGNILSSQAEVIVSSDDNFITMGGGVSAAIKSAGGREIQVDAQKMLPVSVGDVVVSTAGNLPQKYIFHCLTLDYMQKVEQAQRPSSEMNQYILQHSVDKCFRLMESMELNSIAFPCIGEGIAGIPFSQVAEEMVGVIARCLNQTQRPIQVELYLYDRYQMKTEIDYIEIFEHLAVKSALSHQIQAQQAPAPKNTAHVELPALKGSEMEHDVFISYSHKDKDKMLQIKAFLEEQGFRTWVDVEGIYSLGSFKKYVAVAIEHTKTVVFLSSQESNASKYVVEEIGYAIGKEIPVIPVRLDESPYHASLRMNLHNVNHIHYEDSEDFLCAIRVNIEYAINYLKRTE